MRSTPFDHWPACSSPSIRTTNDAGSTPEPRSLAATRIWPPLRTVLVRSDAAGGVASFSQKRNVNAPARVAEGLSKTTSYAPAAGRIVPGREHELAERPQVRVQVERQRGVAGQAPLVAGADDPRLDADAGRAARDDDAEVRRRAGERDPEDALGAGERGAEAESGGALGIPVARDAVEPPFVDDL